MSDSHFDRIAGVYDHSLPSHVVEHYLDKRLVFASRLAPAGSSVLDVGCGTGALAQRLSASGYRVTGADPSAGMLEVLRSRSPEVRAVSASGEQLPFPDGSFDLVLSVATMHHIALPGSVRATLAEMVRVCRSGGSVLVWDHNPGNPYWPRLMARVPQDTGEERLVPAAELLDGLRGAGARIVSLRQLGWVPDFVPPWALGLAESLEAVLERIPGVRRLGAHNVVVATRP